MRSLTQVTQEKLQTAESIDENPVNEASTLRDTKKNPFKDCAAVTSQWTQQTSSMNLKQPVRIKQHVRMKKSM